MYVRIYVLITYIRVIVHGYIDTSTMCYCSHSLDQQKKLTNDRI